MECLGHGFDFPLVYVDAIADCLAIYTKWLQLSEE
jgi:hypothetical protein